MPERSILIIDDDPSLRRVMEFTLEDAGFAISSAENGEEGLVLFQKHRPAVVITDLKMPGISGFDVLQSVLQQAPETLVIVITAFGTIENAVEAMKAGAYDYLTKPFSRDALLLTVQKASRFRGLQNENRALRQRLASRHETGIVTNSPQMEQMIEQAEQVGASDANILILGESGTGKELVAKAIHQASPRATKPYMALNCASIPHNLIESELFGHVKGAFTGATRDRQGRFERADGGTLFLDEIGEMPLENQPKLLRALQEQTFEAVGTTQSKHVDVRIIAATNRDLWHEVQQGAFREDLYYRLNVIALEIPPLRQRCEDVEVLAYHFLRLYAPEKELKISPSLLERLQAYSWPGNVRELENLCQRWAILCHGPQIGENDLPVQWEQQGPASFQCKASVKDECILQLPDDGYSLDELEKEAIKLALRKTDGNRTKAAAFLKIPRHVLLYRLEKYGIS